MTTSARLQDEANVARAGLSSTLDELRNSVTTTALTSGAMTFAKEGSATLARAAIDRAAANPLAALLIGAGVLMLMSNTKGSAAGEAVDKANSAMKNAASALGAAAVGTKAAAATTASATRDAAGSVADAASGAAGYVSETAKQAMNSATAGLEKAKSLVADGQHKATETVDETQKLVSQTADRFMKFSEEQPILVAALGMALGAALGSSLPLTDAEKRYIGDAGAVVTKKGKEIAGNAADAMTDRLAGEDVSAKVGEVFEAVTKTVQTGLSSAS
jgi:hypothetical protein